LGAQAKIKQKISHKLGMKMKQNKTKIDIKLKHKTLQITTACAPQSMDVI